MNANRLVFALWAACCAQAQTELDALATEAMDRQQIPGLMLVAIKGERVVYARGFGVASVETRARITADTLFRVGSTTKMFVAASVVKLAEEGRLRLDAPVGNYMVGLDPKVARLTPHQILSHTAGLMDETRMYGPHDDQALAANVGSWKESVFFTEPGKVYSYSNLGFVLAGRLIEVVKGMPFADALEELMFQPLGMKSTTFRPTIAMTYPLAQGHREGKVIRPAADHAGYWPAGSMFTCGNDFARFAIAFMNDGRIDGDQVLSPSLIATLAKPNVETTGPVAGRSYGYGLAIDASRGGVRVLEHGGSRLGYTSQLMMAPESRAAVIVLGNKDGGQLNGLAERALEQVIGVKFGPPATTAAASNGDLAKLAGTYANGPERIEVALKDSALWVRGARLEPASGNCWRGGPRTYYCFAGPYVHAGGRAYRRQ